MKKLLLILVGILYSTMAYAVPITIEFDYEINYTQLFTSRTVLPSIQRKGKVTFDNIVNNENINKPVHYTSLGSPNTTTWNTTSTSFLDVNSGNINGGVSNFLYDWVRLKVIDYQDSFEERIEFKSWHYGRTGENSSIYWDYYIHFYAARSLNYENNNNIWNSEDTFNFWNAFLISGNSIYIEELVGLYDTNVRQSTAFTGYRWRGKATITNVYEGQPVPEPAACILFGTGLLGLIQLRRKK